MRKYIFALFVIMWFSFLGLGQKPAQYNQLVLPESLTTLSADSVFNMLKRFPENSQIAIALIDHDRVQYWGIIRSHDTLLNTHNDASVFEIGSISKVFTSTLLAHAVVNGSLRLDQPLREVLPQLKDTFQVTFKQLANHTSGLPRLPMTLIWEALKNPQNPYAAFDEAKLEDYLSQSISLVRKPSVKYEYSNIGAGLLGHALAKQANSDYETLLNQLIFKPLDMTESSTKRENIQAEIVTGLDTKGKPTSQWDMAALNGAGGICSSVRDLSKFVQANFDTNNKVLALQRQETFRVSPKMALGLGWHIISTEHGDLHWHNGGTGGYSSSMAIDTLRQKGVVILSNISAMHPKMDELDRLCFSLVK